MASASSAEVVGSSKSILLSTIVDTVLMGPDEVAWTEVVLMSGGASPTVSCVKSSSAAWMKCKHPNDFPHNYSNFLYI